MPTKPNDVWWRDKFAQLRPLADPVAAIEPGEVYPKPGCWPVLKLVWMRYALSIYFPILKRCRETGQYDRLHFVDLAAGSGLTSVPLDGVPVVLPGSAMLGASVKGFDRYHFVEPHRRRAEVLQQRLLTLLPEDAFKVYPTSRAEAVGEIAAEMRRNGRAPHYLCFVDPEGFKEVTLPELGPFFEFPRGDFFFNFQHTGVKRAPEAAAAFLGKPELAGTFASMNHDEIIRLFAEILAELGRPEALWIPVEHGDNSYAYGMMYAAARTDTGNTWLDKFAEVVQQRMEGIDGAKLSGILGGQRSFDSLPGKEKQKRLFEF